jgi:hypothetical protein
MSTSFSILKELWFKVNDYIPAYIFEFQLKNKSFSYKLISKERYIEEKEDIFHSYIQELTKSEALDKIFADLKYCNFIVFQSKTDTAFFQFGIRKHGFFLDYPNTRIIGNVKNFQWTITYLKANGFKETQANNWEYMKYFVVKDKRRSYINAYFGRNIEIIKKCINYLLLEVYKDDIQNYKIILG